MAITSTPTVFSNLCTGRLAAKIDPTTTTGVIITADIFTTPAGTTFQTWGTGNQVWKLTRKTRTKNEVEFIGVESLSQTGSTITTGTVIRYLPADGSSFVSQGNGLPFKAGTIVELIWSAHHGNKTAFTDSTKTWTAKQTFNGGFAPPVFANNTARDVAFPTPWTGLKVVSGTESQEYYNGAWRVLGTATISNGANGAAGIVDIATGAEIAAGTAVDATSGAINVIPVSQTTKTSNGASDENKSPVLQANGALHINHIATGTPSGGKYVRDDGTLAYPIRTVMASLAPSAKKLNFTTESTFSDTNYTYTIPANSMAAGESFVIQSSGQSEVFTANNIVIKIKIGSTVIAQWTVLSTAGGTDIIWVARTLLTCQTIGGSGTFVASTVIDYPPNASASLTKNTIYGTATVDTTTTNALAFTGTSSVNHPNNSVTIYSAHFQKLNAAI